MSLVGTMATDLEKEDGQIETLRILVTDSKELFLVFENNTTAFDAEQVVELYKLLKEVCEDVSE